MGNIAAQRLNTDKYSPHIPHQLRVWFCFRTQLQQIWYAKSTQAYHHRSATGNSSTKMMKEYANRNDGAKEADLAARFWKHVNFNGQKSYCS